MKLLVALLVWLTLFTCYSQSNTLTGSLVSVGQQQRTNVQLTLQIISPKHRTVGQQLVSDDPIYAYTGTNSPAFTFSNIFFGKYSLIASDSSGTPWILYVGTNTIGTVAIASLITNSAAMPPYPGTNYYTQAQIDAMVFAVGGGSPLTNITWGVLTNFSDSTNRAQMRVYFPPPPYNKTNCPYFTIVTNTP